MRIIGLVLFYLGIIVALISAAKLPEPDSLLSDMFPISLGGMLLALVGLLLSYLSKKQQKTQDKTSLSIRSTEMITLLQGLLTELQQMGPEINSLDEKEIAKRVSALLDNHVLPFVATREEVIRLLGNYQGVEVLVAAAQGERLLNRMWSAASDGVVIEARNTYPNALAAFEEAYRRAC
ncbi:membrane protein [Beggiatoa sp. PS]|nr:membrane protein [Beggiatoa sp. PS]